MTDNQVTYEIRGAIYDVYKALGPGLLESCQLQHRQYTDVHRSRSELISVISVVSV